MNLKLRISGMAILGSFFLFIQIAQGQEALSASDLLSLKYCGGVQLSPDGKEVLYNVSTPRGPNDEPGGSLSTYYRRTLPEGTPVPLFQKEAKGSSPRWSPDGKLITFLYSKEDESSQVWAMPASGGKMFRLTSAESGVSSFRWDPVNLRIAYLSATPATAREKELKKRGYGFIFYEENLKNNNLFIARFDSKWTRTGVRQLTEGVNTWDFRFNNQGTQIAASISPLNLIDHRYMFRKIFLIDPETGDRKQVSQNEGKLGNYAFSPDGSHLAYSAALHLNDHEASQAFVVKLENGEILNLTPENFRGHMSWVSWKIRITCSAFPVKGSTRN